MAADGARAGFVEVERSDLEVIRQAIADGELHTTKPVNRALIKLLDALAASHEGNG